MKLDRRSIRHTKQDQTVIECDVLSSSATKLPLQQAALVGSLMVGSMHARCLRLDGCAWEPDAARSRFASDFKTWKKEESETRVSD